MSMKKMPRLCPTAGPIPTITLNLSANRAEDAVASQPNPRRLPSTPASWLESDTENVEFQEESEPLGPFTLAGIFESNGTLNEPDFSTPATKLIIFGDSDFARNRFFFSNDNADLFLNSVNWLTEDFDLISIRPKVFPVRELVVNTRQRDFIKWSSWFLPPIFMILLGAYVWWKRR